MDKKHVYITTTLPYVNADPHLGIALELVHADSIARYWRMVGSEVFFNFGVDEHGQKIYQKAREANKDPRKYVDEYAKKFDTLRSVLGLSYDNFVRTTDPHHIVAAQEFWKLCDANGDIYKKEYRVKYCAGCELEKTDSELEDGCCPLHPKTELEIREEENYFFRFSNYGDRLMDFYRNNPDFVIPHFRLNEFTNFIKEGLQDFSISRLREKMPWGIPVPGDSDHVMYVWFDALVNYISAIGWPDDMERFNAWWPVIQYAGKDQVRMQAGMWTAMLMSAHLPPSKQIVIHGFITSNGKKMSKSIGNVVPPSDIAEEYGTDALRLYLLREVPAFEDGDFTPERFKYVYNGSLSNGLGNTVSRVLSMSNAYGVSLSEKKELIPGDLFYARYHDSFSRYALHEVANLVWERLRNIDREVQERQPFKMIRTNEQRAKEDLRFLLEELSIVAYMLAPILPETSKKILHGIEINTPPEELLFPRKE